MSYKSTRRQWVKLWVNEWLDGTTRFELTPQQRIVWIDLLALAGRSRFPGFVYAGHSDSNTRVGYPIEYLAGVLQMDEVTLNNTLKLLQDKGHITLEESQPEKYIIGIVNWEKYQSEYLRQKAYRKVTTETTSRLLVEGEKKERKQSPLPPFDKGGVSEMRFSDGILRIHRGRHKRIITDRDRSLLVGARVADAKFFFERKGFKAEIVPNTNKTT
jgi:replisome organiser protein